ncbi:MAG: CYTH domain-containing protein [Nitrospinota bacterium]|nr:CYTH domain-containing protein [Nitrospinota bacterium]
MVEIEKKFLVRSAWGESHSSSLIEQGYLFIEKSRSLRVRRHNEEYFLTVKIEKSQNERFEFESKLEEEHGKLLLEKHCISNIISKIRNIVFHDDKKWEIDVFKAENQHLIIAEIELSSTDDQFICPSWLGPEVTQQIRYLNSHLTLKPFSEWGITYENLLLEESKKSEKKTYSS